MDKKGTEYTLKQIVGWIIVLVIILTIIFSFYSPQGLLRKAGDWFGDYADKVFKELGLGKTNPTVKTDIDIEIEEYFEYLYNYFIKETSGTDCTLVYKQTPDLEDYKIEIFNSKGGLYMRLLDKENKEVKLLPEKGKGPDLQPCIIAGENNEAKNFYDCKLTDGECRMPMYSSIGKIILQDEQILMMDNKEYKLHDRADELSKINLLYKFDESHVCFFTTNRYNDHDNEGLDDNIILNIYAGNYPVHMCFDKNYCSDNNILKCGDYDKTTCNKNPCDLEPSCMWAYKIIEEGDSQDNILKKEGYCTESTTDCKAITQCEDYTEYNCYANPCSINPGCIYEFSGSECIRDPLSYDCTRINDCSGYRDREECVANVCDKEFDCMWLWPVGGNGVDGRCTESDSYCDGIDDCGYYTNEQMCYKNPCKISSGCTWDISTLSSTTKRCIPIQ